MFNVYTECYLDILCASYLQASDNCPNYLKLSVFVALFCCLPLGGVAIRYSLKVYDLIHNAFNYKDRSMRLIILFRLKKLLLMEDMEKEMNLPKKLP